MTTILSEILERRVQVIGSGGFNDTGVLEACDEGWLTLRKDDGELLYLSILSLRLVKLLP